MTDVQYFDEKTGTLKHPQEHKIEQILLHRCLVEVGGGKYNCRPIAGYNSRTYELQVYSGSRITCNCQGYVKRGTCSHEVALIRFLATTKKQMKLF